MIIPTIGYSAAIGASKGLPALRAELNVAAVLAGLGTFGAYALVLEALARAPAAPVAAARETSVVIAAVLARAFLKEPVSASRFAGAALVAGGVALVSL